MNPHASYPVSLRTMLGSFLHHRHLIVQMTQREIIGRYKGSVMGLAWSFFHPALMLTVYTFVFSVVFKSRWGNSAVENKTEFALLLFVGMIMHGLLAEVLNRSPAVILSNTNYVKRVVFPLEILPVISLCAALFHSMVSLLVLLLAFFVFNHYVAWTVIFLPLVLMPLLILALGVGWLLASLGVYLRDVGQTVGVLSMVLMFLSPVFYPVDALPPQFRPWLLANPLSFIIEQARDVLIWGRLPAFVGLLSYTVVAVLIAWTGYAWFQKTRKGFADVL